ncbi:transmembrane protein [Ceratobasidium sp. AG-Ba]|nr:transmembrane protein [Ceratobasidium sp. AG-Ba]
MATPQSSRRAGLGSMSFLPPYRSDSKEQFSPIKDQVYTDKARIIDDKFEDPYGPRLGKAARFWRVYVQESDLSDEELSRGWNEYVNSFTTIAPIIEYIFLAVAGCWTSYFFLCVLLTALIHQSYNECHRRLCSLPFARQSLQYLTPDEAEKTNDMLLIISRSLLANANHSISLPTEAMLQPAEFSPPKHAIVTNTLWFLSLMISLSVTLISILAKEWCHVYMAGRTGPMHEQARRRQQRFDGLNKWRMKGLIAFLPTFMHISLFLFVIGLSIHLWAIYNSIAKPVIAFTAVMISLYLALTITPFISEFCPYTTAFSRLLTDLWLKGRDKINHTNDIPSDNIPMDIVTSRALSWVISHCENEKSVDVALQAIAGANHSLPCEPLWRCNAAGLVSQRLHGCFLAEGLPVTNSGFESLINLGHESSTFRLIVPTTR